MWAVFLCYKLTKPQAGKFPFSSLHYLHKTHAWGCPTNENCLSNLTHAFQNCHCNNLFSLSCAFITSPAPTPSSPHLPLFSQHVIQNSCPDKVIPPTSLCSPQRSCHGHTLKSVFPVLSSLFCCFSCFLPIWAGTRHAYGQGCLMLPGPGFSRPTVGSLYLHMSSFLSFANRVNSFVVN